MELGKVCKGKRKGMHFHGGTIAFNPDAVLVIRIPEAQVLRILSRSLFLAIVIVSLPFLGTILTGFPSSSSSSSSLFSVSGTRTYSGYLNAGLLNSVVHDLAEEGLFKKDDKALLLSSFHGGFGFGFGFGSVAILNNNEVDVVMDSDLEMKKGLFPDESYDFVFTSSEDAEFVDRILKVGGIVALPLAAQPLNAAFREQSNYRIVYLRRYDCIIVALRKTSPATIKLADDSSSSKKRKLCKFGNEEKKMVLEGLEDVLLEPPREVDTKLEYRKSFKYLPDLSGDPLEGYSRRLFIEVGLAEENKGVIQWFEHNYPKKNTEFETRSINADDASAWLSKHVKEEEYVVMKAEAEVVEEMIKKRTVCLVDELFLECKNEWWQKGKRKSSRRRRAYWECLALYGRLRDEGVAVHQWWG
ncbi:uncharacterized protein LOC107468702 [Arachis duranensis]|uniref:Uncharacterized protein LOC107468702 n=1 Tax=Arachis duranensis TaxID=130453 RepID=A0A6P4BPD1_ARADU|nr:uncharacterized protein LOC107468702 [Arachis duranensis]XP_025622282.1 uncharacterized protein LOC112714818 [Arachis hypogaea]QHO15117.1 uncharacterized protein DS421_10g292140 [Arachis hypogaea]